MSTSDQSRPRLGLADAKRISRALHQELSKSRPGSGKECQELVSRLPLPSIPSPAVSDIWIYGTAAQIAEYFVSRLPKENGPGSKMWTGRAISLLSAVLSTLVWQRDNLGLQLTEDVVLNSLQLDVCIDQSRCDGIPQSVRMPLLAYLRSIPGFDPLLSRQRETAQEKHQYVSMMFTNQRDQLRRRPEVITISDPESVIPLISAVQESTHSADVGLSIHSDDLPLVVQGPCPHRAVSLGQVIEENAPGLHLETQQQSKQLSWTLAGLRAHGLMFGSGQLPPSSAVSGLGLSAIEQGVGLTLISSRPSSVISELLRHTSAHSNAMRDRIRVISLAKGSMDFPSHSFNPFAAGHFSQHVELLLDAISGPGSLFGLPKDDETALLIALFNAVLYPLSWGRHQKLWEIDLPRIVHCLRLPALLELHHTPNLPPQCHISLRAFLARLLQIFPDQTQQQAYSRIETVLVDQILDPVVRNYKDVFSSQTTHRLDVSASSVLDDRLITLIELPDQEKYSPDHIVASRLLTSALSAEVINRHQKDNATPAVIARHLVIADNAPVYLSSRSVSQLLRFGPHVGVGCVLTARNYPQLSTAGLSEHISLLNTKIFFSSVDPHQDQSNPILSTDKTPGIHAKVISGSKLWSVDMTPPASPPPDNFLDTKKFTPGQVDPSRMSKVLLTRLSSAPEKIKLSWCQETLARMLGYAHWHDLSS